MRTAPKVAQKKEEWMEVQGVYQGDEAGSKFLLVSLNLLNLH
jgi:hypothetical protein